ncbi:DUF5997 family protein [Parafrigoribacterium mesophilum]|uniref:DUF5997 family protein n=1 Tax=Parafrigoribacterium mesophilum TaxID=433646 RepID=UPI0031FDE78B
MTAERAPQTMKAATAAKKLGIHLPATPAQFQNSEVSRTELAALNAAPPAWLTELRANGPHPRQVVAGKLGVSIAGLARSGVTEPLTTAEIRALLADPPQWLVRERATQAKVRQEKNRVKARDAALAEDTALLENTEH